MALISGPEVVDNSDKQANMILKNEITGEDGPDCEQPVVSVDPYDVNRNGEWDYCYKVKLSIGHQSFLLDYEGDTKEEAEWMAKMLIQALGKLIR